ncbi:MAG: hypothetical protein K0R46_2798 [Herbinix sp.]|nr:hypothetical protein [Herbinix sp.]
MKQVVNESVCSHPFSDEGFFMYRIASYSIKNRSALDTNLMERKYIASQSAQVRKMYQSTLFVHLIDTYSNNGG